MRISDGSSDVCSSDLGRASGGNACITSRCKRGCDRPGVHRNDRFRGTRKPHFFLQEGKRKKLALNDSECQYSPYQWLRTKNSLLTRLNVAPKSGRSENIPANKKRAEEDRRQDHVPN